jgi:hypothetical protein
MGMESLPVGDGHGISVHRRWAWNLCPQEMGMESLSTGDGHGTSVHKRWAQNCVQKKVNFTVCIVKYFNFR